MATKIKPVPAAEFDADGSTSGNKRKGFASLSKARRTEIASKGGKAAHLRGTAHEWSPEEARLAGRKGGVASQGGRGRNWRPPYRSTPKLAGE